MKRALLLCVFGLVVAAAGGLLWFKQHGGGVSPSAGTAEAKPTGAEAAGPHVVTSIGRSTAGDHGSRRSKGDEPGLLTRRSTSGVLVASAA